MRLKRKIGETKNWFFENTDGIDRPPIRLTKGTERRKPTTNQT